MTVWKRAKHWDMPNRMRVKWKYSYLDGRLEDGQELGERMRVEGKYSFLNDSMKEGQA
jgi:hypothetical protein